MVFAVLAVVAQTEARPEGVLYLTDERVKSQMVADCNVGTYGLNTTNGSLGKVYVGRSLLLTSCATVFEFNATEATTVEGNVTANLLMGCDSTTVLRSVSTLATIRAEFHKNGAMRNFAQGFAPSMTCSPNSQILFDLVIPHQATPFQAGDRIGLRLSVWALTGDETAGKNVHMVVGGANASAIRAVGFPGGADEADGSNGTTDASSETSNASNATSGSASSTSASASSSSASGSASSNASTSKTNTSSKPPSKTTVTSTATTTETATSVGYGPPQTSTMTVTVSGTGPAVTPSATGCPSANETASATPTSSGAANNTTTPTEPATSGSTDCPPTTSNSTREAGGTGQGGAGAPAAATPPKRGGNAPSIGVTLGLATLSAVIVVLATRRQR